MTVSIIIAVKTWQKNLEECLSKCREVDYPDFEILVMPDEQGLSPQLAKPLETKGTVPVRVIPTGPVSPGRKRDMAIVEAKGEILAFIDDDAYPPKDWLKNALKNFIDLGVAAVGGPAITPPEDNIMQRASGLIYASLLVSGRYILRYLPKNKTGIDDYPSCNFLVRKSIFEKAGGFNTDFWPGEDTKLCLDITKKLGKKIIYDPQVMVYHHRRPVFLPHLSQISSYARHRGYFVKKFPETSLRFSYFLPTLFLFGLVSGGILAFFFSSFRIIYLGGLSLYMLLVFIFSISKEARLMPLVFSGIILTHLTYGLYFLQGLFSPRLKEEL